MSARRPLPHAAALLIPALLVAPACVSRTACGPGPRPVQVNMCGRAFVFVDHGRPAARIEIPIDPDESERRAAEILRTSILKMSGVDLPVREVASPDKPGAAVIGFPGTELPRLVASSLPTLRDDGFILATSTGNLYIAGGGGKGLVYGVVHLLEKYFGCRKFSPTAELFPKTDDLVLGCLFESQNPGNEVRIVNGDFAQDADWLDWTRLQTPAELYGTGFYVHTLGRLVPWQTYFESHPEYFALMNGKRIIEEEGSPAGPILRFVDRIAALFPDKVISTLAYQYSRPAPRLTRPLPNVEIMLCTIELDRSRPIAETPESASFVRDIEDWSRICGNLYLWDYTVNFSHHVSPFPNLPVLQPNLRFFYDHGVRRHFQQTNTGPGHEFSELKSYLLARLLWDPKADVTGWSRDFLEGYYGKAGLFIGQYIDALDAALGRTGARLDIYEPPAVHAGDYLSAADTAFYDALFDKAESAVAHDPECLVRVRTARLPLMYAEIEIGKADMFGPRGFYEEKDGRFVSRPGMVRLVDDFYERCRAGGVRTLSEGGLTPEAYRDGVRRFIDVQVEGNRAFRRSAVADPPPAPKYAGGDLAVLTDGVRGATDYKVHWLGWEGVDPTLTLDLGRPVAVREISLSTLSDWRSWILHPDRVGCEVSTDGASWREVGARLAPGDHRDEEAIRAFIWPASPDQAGAAVPIRFVRLRIEGNKRLPAWHASAGGLSWVFVDEIVVR